MLHPLPFTTFGEIAASGLVVRASCSRRHGPSRLIDLMDHATIDTTNITVPCAR
jgi:hypothetical protein